jgi:hypothetical protein
VAIEPLQVHAYYLRRTVKKVVAPPAGLRIVAGGTRDTVRFTCIVQRMPQRVTQMVPKCDRGMFAIGIAFPECWNGVDLDSADHRSHMAYAADGVCPPSHPVAVPRLRLFVGYPRPPATAALTLASGPMETAHADFFNAWQPEMLDTLVRHCLNAQRPRNCSKHGNRRLAQLDAALARPEATAPLPPSSTDPVPTDPAPPAPPVDGALLDSGTAVSDASRSEPVVSAAAAFVESNHVPGCGLGAEPAPI